MKQFFNNIFERFFEFFYKNKATLISSLEKELEIAITDCDAVYLKIYEKEKEFNEAIELQKLKIKKLEEELLFAKTRLLEYKDRNRKAPKADKDQNKLKQWADRVKKSAGYKCDICSESADLTAHHLWDKSTHPTLMFQDENGVCLCSVCHRGFHSKHSGTHCSPSAYQKYKIFRQGLMQLSKR